MPDPSHRGRVWLHSLQLPVVRMMDTTIDTARDMLHVEPGNMVEKDIIAEEGIIVEKCIMTVVVTVIIGVGGSNGFSAQNRACQSD